VSARKKAAKKPSDVITVRKGKSGRVVVTGNKPGVAAVEVQATGHDARGRVIQPAQIKVRVVEGGPERECIGEYKKADFTELLEAIRVMRVAGATAVVEEIDNGSVWLYCIRKAA
jgi:hypothetical protein